MRRHQISLCGVIQALSTQSLGTRLQEWSQAQRCEEMESLHRSQFRLLTPPWLCHQLSAKSITKQSAKQAARESCLLPALTLAQPQSPQRETRQRRKRCFENTCLCCYMFYHCWAIHGIGNRMTNHQRLFQKDQQFDSMFSWVFNLEYETLTWTHREG